MNTFANTTLVIKEFHFLCRYVQHCFIVVLIETFHRKYFIVMFSVALFSYSVEAEYHFSVLRRRVSIYRTGNTIILKRVNYFL